MNSNEQKIKQTASLLRKATHAVALTGAGISTPSGIPDFRSPSSGLWSHADPFQVATIYAFKQRPQDFYDWIRPLTQLMLDATPNPAHIALAQLEAHGPLKSVITQNIDLLHTRAGSQTVYELHGHIREMTCIRCYHVFDAAPYLQDVLTQERVPHCPACGGVLKPNVILFGEQLPVRVFNEARKESRTCDLMLIIGTSLEVEPAANLPLLARETGAHLVIINESATYMDSHADVVIRADVADILPQITAAFLSHATEP
ncbi:MAG: NAD-dependent deacylase [Anaerolineales bacterium]|nr:NAD-dependent deacylase [Anaerolineales bacterium]MCB8953872.1 NAD-dependent deacylase [Ardenticatenales bacterium]